MSKANPDASRVDVVMTGIDKGPKRTFSVELQTYRITEKGIDLQVVRIDDVLTYMCLCPECGRGYPAKTSLMLHMKVDHLELLHSAGNREDDVTKSTEIETGTSEIMAVENYNSRPVEDETNIVKTLSNELPTKRGNSADATSTETAVNPSPKKSARIRARQTSVASQNEVKPDCDRYRLSHSKEHTDTSAECKTARVIHSTTSRGKEERGWRKGRAAKTTSSTAEAVDERGKTPCSVIDEEDDQAACTYDNLVDHGYHKPAVLEADKGKGGSGDIPDGNELHDGGIANSSEHNKPSASSSFPRRRQHRRKKSVDISNENLEKQNVVKKMPSTKKEQQPQTPFECDICGKKYSAKNERHFLDHKNSHTGVKPYVCTVCNVAFAMKARLCDHIRMHKTGGGIQCEVCGKYSRCQSALKQHMNVHTGARPHQCKVCNKWFRRKENLSVHMRSHTGEKPYACTVCDRSFSQASILNDHMATHSDARLLCPHCGQKFKQRTCLRLHIQVQHGGKPETCTICGKVFKAERYLKLHYKSHDKPHLCSVCGTGFSRRYKMVNHIRKQHTDKKPIKCTTNKKLIKCTTCCLAFETQDAFNSHLRKEHREVSRVQDEGVEISTVSLLDDDSTPNVNRMANVIIVFDRAAELTQAVKTEEDSVQAVKTEEDLVETFKD